MTQSKRQLLFIGGIIAVAVACICRLFYLQVIQHDFFLEKSKSQLRRIINLYPNRGYIFDRDFKPLALTVPSYQLYAIPSEIENKWEFSKAVAPHLGKNRKELSDKLYNSSASFLWLDRQVSKASRDAIKGLKLKGWGAIKSEKRVYPHKELASNLMGFVGVDNQGLGGIEFKYDSLLKGSSGRIVLEGDPRGNRLISGKKIHTAPKDGKTIVTTIDHTIQYYAEKYLAEAVEKHEAEAGHVIIMDPKNGDVLALACNPTFDPNSLKESTVNQRRIRGVSDIFEPGSIFKLITLAAALEEDLVSSQTTMHVPETYTLYNKTIKEAHPRPDDEPDTKTVSEIIEKSLNVGTTLLAIKLGQERFYKYMKDFGFGTRTGIELPGEARGILRNVKEWSGVDIGTISFGQGIAVTGLQMVSAISAIANDGVYIKPRIVQYHTDRKGMARKAVPINSKERVISAKTALEVRRVMERVVTKGTGQALQIKGYPIGGKTGTAQKVREDGLGYEKGKYIASFIGLFPVEDPQIVMLVAIDSPKKGYYGSQVAGPVFKNCALAIIDHYNIPPSKASDSRLSGSKIE